MCNNHDVGNSDHQRTNRDKVFTREPTNNIEINFFLPSRSQVKDWIQAIPYLESGTDAHKAAWIHTAMAKGN